MDELLQLLNRIQEIFSVLGIRCGNKAFPELPQIVITGEQGCGKSSILESLVGRPFLPRVQGVGTRCPLVLQLLYASNKDLSRVANELACSNVDAWGCFGHRPEHKYTRFEEIRQEIVSETIRLAGEQNDISTEPIYLKIYSNCVNLTFVDLPGLIKTPSSDQPDDIEARARNLVLEYTSMPNCIILAVVAANSDLANCESLQLAQQVDPTGMKTLMVVTKLDLVDNEINVNDILSGRVISVRLGIVGVVNRSQREKSSGKTIAQAILDESNFLKLHYPKLASRNGVPFLAKSLQHLLIDKIRSYMPEIRSAVVSMTNHYQIVLKDCGEPVVDKGQSILNIITEYCSIFSSCIKGNANDLDTAELSEGARISYIFQESYGRALESINPLNGYSKAKILTAMRNASGTCPGIFIPEASFELLVKQQIKQLEEPSILCADLVYQELERVTLNSARKCAKELQRFHNLYRKVLDISSDIIRSCLPETHTMIRQLISIQMAYINTNHPDFVKDAVLINTGTQSPSESCKDDSCCGGDGFEYTQTKINCPLMKPTVVDRGTGENIFHGNNDDTYLSFQRKQTIHILDNREQSDCVIIEELIRCYFNIVRKSIQDSVPKAIMYCLVNHVMDTLQPQLVAQLYQPDQFDDLLTESSHIADKRKETGEIIQVLARASDVINEIRDFHTLFNPPRLW